MNATAASTFRFADDQPNAPVDLQVAITGEVLDEIIQLRKKEYAPVYPLMDLDNDVLDEQAIILYTRSTTGTIDSTARLTLEGKYPLPEQEYLGDYHERGLRLMEWGRFINVTHDRRRLKSYYRAVYSLGVRLGIDAIIMAMKPRNISLHQSLMGLRVLAADTGVTYGGQHSLACVSWELASTKEKFFSWIQ